MDAQGRALGLVLGSVAGGQNLNFAVPIENVLGLTDAPVAQTFGSGAALQLPAESTTVKAPKPVQPQPAEPAKAAPPSEDLARSELLRSKDPDFILRNFRTMYVDTRKAQFFGNRQMQGALARNKDFAAMHFSMIDDPGLADVILEVGYTFAWDFPFTLKHQNTGIILLAGKGVAPFSGPAGAASVAKQLIKLLRPYRTTPPAPQTSS